MPVTESTFRHNIDIQWKAGRQAELSCLSVTQPLSIGTTTDLEKGLADTWSADYLFVAAVESCFLTTFLAVAEHAALHYSSFECSALGCFGEIDGKAMVSDIILKPIVTVSGSHEVQKALHILNSIAEKSRIIHSIKARIHVAPTVAVQEQETK